MQFWRSGHPSANGIEGWEYSCSLNARMNSNDYLILCHCAWWTPRRSQAATTTSYRPHRRASRLSCPILSLRNQYVLAAQMVRLMVTNPGPSRNQFAVSSRSPSFQSSNHVLNLHQLDFIMNAPRFRALELEDDQYERNRAVGRIRCSTSSEIIQHDRCTCLCSRHSWNCSLSL